MQSKKKFGRKTNLDHRLLAILLMLIGLHVGVSRPLYAENTGVSGTNLEFFHPAIDSLGAFGVNDARLLKAGQYSLKLSQSFAGDHLFPIAINNIPLDLVDTVFTTDFVASIGISDFLTTGLDIPLHLYAREGNINSAQSFTTESMGDLRLGMKLRILEEKKMRPRMAFLLTTSFPTGDEKKFLGTTSLHHGIELLTGKDFGFVDLMTSFGAFFPEQKNVLGFQFDDVITYGTAMKVPFKFWDPHMSVLVEMRGHFMPGNLQSATSPLEFIAGLQKEFLSGLTVNIGLGGASKNAIGTPRVRGLVTISFSPQRRAKEMSQSKWRGKETEQWLQTTVSFQSGSRHPTGKSTQEIRNTAQAMSRYPRTIELACVVGHTDNTGSHKWNTKLSYLRAQAVKDLLVHAGVEPWRIEIMGVNSNNPIAPNETQQGRSLNRRAEILVLSRKRPTSSKTCD